jgi:hypothetical protein
MNTKMTQFHDWTLVDVVFEWAQASVAVALNGPSSRCVLLAEDVSLLEMPREEPWGRSVSVNSLLIDDMSDGDKQSLEIEMQSGDVIRVKAKKITVQEKP